jgi:beta-1,4-mannosyl-glycoprotein beta-1,4-N-acetylglucosaminyltransferase
MNWKKVKILNTLKINIMKKYKIYDCILFMNEFDILELRFNILNPIVDYFVIVEANRNMKGDIRELLFEKNKHRYEKFLHKIIYLTIEPPNQYIKLPIIDNPQTFKEQCINDTFKNMLSTRLFDRYTQPNYGILYYTREAMKIPLEHCNDSDVIITSDCDEIPNPEILQRLDEFYNNDEFYSFTQTCYHYYLNVLRESHINNVAHSYPRAEPYTGIKSSKWKGSKMSSFKMLKNYSLNEIRMQPSNDISNGGWHFSFMGGKESIKQKLLSGCIDRNYNDLEKIIKNIEHTLNNLQGITYNEDILKKVEFDDSYPEYILQNLDKYKHLIL